MNVNEDIKELNDILFCYRLHSYINNSITFFGGSNKVYTDVVRDLITNCGSTVKC